MHVRTFYQFYQLQEKKNKKQNKTQTFSTDQLQ